MQCPKLVANVLNNVLCQIQIVRLSDNLSDCHEKHNSLNQEVSILKSRLRIFGLGSSHSLLIEVLYFCSRQPLGKQTLIILFRVKVLLP